LEGLLPIHGSLAGVLQQVRLIALRIDYVHIHETELISSRLIRLHAPFITEEEIETIVEFLKSQREVVYDESFLNEPGSLHITGANDVKNSKEDDFDELYEEAKSIVLSDKKTSISYLQRRLQIGYNRAARIVEQLELTGVISAPNAKGQREILV